MYTVSMTKRCAEASECLTTCLIKLVDVLQVKDSCKSVVEMKPNLLHYLVLAQKSCMISKRLTPLLKRHLLHQLYQ